MGEVDGKRIAIGGIAYDSQVTYAFMKILPEAKRYPVSLYKASVKAMRMIREQGAIVVYAQVSKEHTMAPRFLTRLGFTHLIGGIWKWQKT